MDLGKKIELFLPQYLSEDGMNNLKEDLRLFGEGYDYGNYFTTRLKDDPGLFQGDGVTGMVFRPRSTKFVNAKAAYFGGNFVYL